MKDHVTKSFIYMILFLLPVISSAEVSKIVFTTDPQSIKPNELSEAITIQAQDSSGSPFQTPETIDLEFESTSPSGEFLGSTGNAATKYMSTNTANRTFYYRDSSSGTFTLRVSGKGRMSGKEWSASQAITISSSAASTPSNSSRTSSSNTSSSESSSSYSNTSAGTVNQNAISSSFEIFAGNDRLTSSGSPISFSANVKKNPTSNAKINYSWSFGDGSVGANQDTSHTYKYPGTYAVVLNAKSGSYQTVSRLKVEVTKPELEMKEETGFVEISNLSDKEINLFNWKLKSGIKTFIFQPDTIILPRSSVQFDKELLRFDLSIGQDLVLEDSLGRKIVSQGSTSHEAQITDLGLKGPSESLISLESQAQSIKGKILALQKDKEEGNEADKPKKAQATAKNVVQAASVAIVVSPVETASTTGSQNLIYESPKKIGFISKLTNFIKRVLFE